MTNHDNFYERRKENIHWSDELTQHRIEERERTQEILDSIKKIKDVSLSEEELNYIKLAVKREARKEQWQQAVIDKTTISLIWSMIVGVVWSLWETFKHFIIK